jgi:hypothetical protein
MFILLCLFLRGVSKKFGEWHQKTNRKKSTSPPYSPDLAPAPDQGSTVGGLLFPRLNSIMKGARFAEVAAIQERVTAVPRSIPKEAFADSFQKLYERCQRCVVKNGDYFEGQ